MKIRQKQQADQTERGIHDGRTKIAQHPERVFECQPPGFAAGIGRADMLPRVTGEVVRVEDVKHPGDGNQQHHRPQRKPAHAFAQIRQHAEQKRHAKQSANPWQQIGAEAEQNEEPMGEMRAHRPDQIVNMLVVRLLVKCEVIAVKRQLREQQQTAE